MHLSKLKSLTFSMGFKIRSFFVRTSYICHMAMRITSVRFPLQQILIFFLHTQILKMGILIVNSKQIRQIRTIQPLHLCLCYVFFPQVFSFSKVISKEIWQNGTMQQFHLCLCFVTNF